MIVTERSKRLLHSKRQKLRRTLGGCSLTGDGSVCRLPLLERPFRMLKLTTARIVPGNTRVISQTALDHFRTSLTTKSHDPYSVLLRRNKLPMVLLDEAKNPHAQKVRFRYVFFLPWTVLIFYARGHISSRQNRFKKHLAPNVNGRNPG